MQPCLMLHYLLSGGKRGDKATDSQTLVEAHLSLHECVGSLARCGQLLKQCLQKSVEERLRKVTTTGGGQGKETLNDSQKKMFGGKLPKFQFLDALRWLVVGFEGDLVSDTNS